MLFIAWNTQRGSWSYTEKRRGRKETEVTRRREEVKRRETDLAHNPFPKCPPQPRTPTKIHRIGLRREGGGKK